MRLPKWVNSKGFSAQAVRRGTEVPHEYPWLKEPNKSVCSHYIHVTDKTWWWPRPCVYALFYQGQIVWVGQSVNLANRLLNHVDAQRPFDGIWFCDVPKEQLDIVEQYLLLQVFGTENIRLIVTAEAYLKWRPHAE